MLGSIFKLLLTQSHRIPYNTYNLNHGKEAIALATLIQLNRGRFPKTANTFTDIRYNLIMDLER